ncbi:hypothetical protein KBX37_32555 [Micromonospora sp. U56]|uniref:hypothetical protein n=1 Tax=Micromonospora sp. U56 TaxID=2824900 RepID=UPI001B36965C|nr:hypothetical protein [Micromonospora sp. U56]MBQ0897729.1 hypothetical protein [Micromonospora sp. U56]
MHSEKVITYLQMTSPDQLRWARAVEGLALVPIKDAAGDSLSQLQEVHDRIALAHRWSSLAWSNWLPSAPNSSWRWDSRDRGRCPASRGRSGISTAKVIGLVGTLVVAFLTYVGLTVDALSGMRQKLAGHEPYPRGSWPRSTTTNLEDGSLRDGDGTDWRMKY